MLLRATAFKEGILHDLDCTVHIPQCAFTHDGRHIVLGFTTDVYESSSVAHVVVLSAETHAIEKHYRTGGYLEPTGRVPRTGCMLR